MTEEFPWQKVHVEVLKKDGDRTAMKDPDEGWLSTFDKSVAAPLVEGKDFEVQYVTKPSKDGQRMFKNLTAVREITNGVPEAYSHQKPDGEADWDKVAIGKTRCALWMHYLSGQLAAGIYVKASNAEGVDPREAVVRAGISLVAAAEKDVFERPPGDDGIPF